MGPHALGACCKQRHDAVGAPAYCLVSGFVGYDFQRQCGGRLEKHKWLWYMPKTPPLVAIFTYHDPVGDKAGRNDFQTQGIAYSLDKGRTWNKYDQNPVLKNPGIRDFRDPKVSWNEVSQPMGDGLGRQ
jgi:hypothetical protein